MKKKERFTVAHNDKFYEVAGRWEDAIVLSPVDPEDDNCLIYTAGEIAEFLLTGRLQKETEEKRAFFGRKIADLEALKELTQTALSEGQIGSAYQVTKEVLLSSKEFEQFASNFFDDQPWISPKDGGINESGEDKCIRVINKETGERVLVNSEGYSYPRYTVLEK